MARTLDDLIRNLTNFENNLKVKAPTFIMFAGKIYLEKKKEKIYNSGVGRYSSKKYHASSLKGKQLTQAGLSFLETKIQNKEKTNWAGLRNAEGLQTSFVDLWYSGTMWKNTDAVKGNQTVYRYFVTIGAKDKEQKRKLLANYERYGNFLAPSKEEITEIKNNLAHSIFELLKLSVK